MQNFVMSLRVFNFYLKLLIILYDDNYSIDVHIIFIHKTQKKKIYFKCLNLNFKMI